MIGFTRDDVPRDNEAIQHDSGLWVAGAGYLERLDRTPKDPEGGVAAVTALAPGLRPAGGSRVREAGAGMTAPAGTPGVDRPVHPADLLGTFAVVCRGPGQVEVIAAPENVNVLACIVLHLVGAGAASCVSRPDGLYLTLGYAWPISASGRVVYRLSSDPQAAIGLGGITARIEGTRVA